MKALICMFFAFGMLLNVAPWWATEARAQEDWQPRRLLLPTGKELPPKQRGQVFVYNGLQGTDQEMALRDHAGRIPQVIQNAADSSDATILQQDAFTAITRIDQRSRGDAANTSITAAPAASNGADVSVSGGKKSADMVPDGPDSLAVIDRFGNWNTVDIARVGDTHDAVVFRTGDHSRAAMSQVHSDNVVTLRQFDFGLADAIKLAELTGDDNGAATSQVSWARRATNNGFGSSLADAVIVAYISQTGAVPVFYRVLRGRR